MADYRLIVIGAGPGGYVAAIKAAQLGGRVALVENREVGGTCLNRGCVPTKTLLHATELLEEIKACAGIGITVEGVSCTLAALHARKDEVLAQLRTGIEGLLKANKVELLRGTGTLVAAGQVAVEGSIYTAENVLVATGSVPACPPIPGLGLAGVYTSDDLLATGAPELRRLIIIGGGVIGVEFAGIYRALGCEVTIVEALERILPTMEKEISQNLSMILKKRGIQIYTGAVVEELTAEDGITCRMTAKGKEVLLGADGVLVATGRRANTEGLLGEGVDLHLERGRIPVDARFETCIKGVYAIGDVIKGGIQLAHVASAQGTNAVAAIYGKTPPINLAVVPACVYTNPEIATVGMSSEDAAAQGIPVKTGKFLMSANAKNLIARAERGFIKVLLHAESGVLLGAQLMCPRATDLIGELATAVANGLTAEQLAAVIRPHPTFCEGVTEAVEDALGGAVHIAPRR